MDENSIALWLAGVIVAAGLVGFAAIWKRVTDFTEAHAAPRRAKPEEDRTLIDKMIIEADRRADLLNIEQYNTFLESYVAAYLVDILKKAPVVGPMVVAADYVDDMLDKLADGNPELAKRLDQSYETAKRKLAGAIGQAMQENGVVIKPAVDDEWRAPHIPVSSEPGPLGKP